MITDSLMLYVNSLDDEMVAKKRIEKLTFGGKVPNINYCVVVREQDGEPFKYLFGGQTFSKESLAEYLNFVVLKNNNEHLLQIFFLNTDDTADVCVLENSHQCLKINSIDAFIDHALSLKSLLGCCQVSICSHPQLIQYVLVNVDSGGEKTDDDVPDIEYDCDVGEFECEHSLLYGWACKMVFNSAFIKDFNLLLIKSKEDHYITIKKVIRRHKKDAASDGCIISNPTNNALPYQLYKVIKMMNSSNITPPSTTIQTLTFLLNTFIQKANALDPTLFPSLNENPAYKKRAIKKTVDEFTKLAHKCTPHKIIRDCILKAMSQSKHQSPLLENARKRPKFDDSYYEQFKILQPHTALIVNTSTDSDQCAEDNVPLDSLFYIHWSERLRGCKELFPYWR